MQVDLPLRARREELGRGLREMAGICEINAGNLSLIEKGRLFPLDDEIVRIEEAYGLTRTEIWPIGLLLDARPDDKRRRRLNA